MYERFTDRARKVMLLANQEARRFNHEHVGTEHVLLGIVKEGSGTAAKAFKNLDVDLGQIRLEIEKLIQSGPEMITMGKLPQTLCTKKVIEQAMATARELNHNYVGTEHLVLGLAQIENVAQQVLLRLNVTTDNLRGTILELLGHSVDDWREDAEFTSSESPKHPWYHPKTRERQAATTSLVEQARIGFPPFRQPQELNPLITALNRSWRNSVLIIGKRGVGKRALAERLASEILNGDASVLHGAAKQINEINPRDSLGGTEKRLLKSRARRLLFVENIHLGLADYQDQRSFARYLSTALSEGVRCIATTTENHVESFLACEELAAHFEQLRLAPASTEQSFEIAKSRVDEYEHNHSVRFGDDAFREACELAERYGDVLFPNHAQPVLTLDVLEYAAAFTDWKQAAKDGKAEADEEAPVTELHAHDIQHSVAMRLSKDIDDVKARK